MIQNKEELFAKLEATGEPKVRENLAQDVYGEGKRQLVNEWLHQKEAAREAELTEAQAQREHEALAIAREANKIAVDANTLSHRANVSASKANRIAWWSVAIALVATVVTVTQCQASA